MGRESCLCSVRAPLSPRPPWAAVLAVLAALATLTALAVLAAGGVLPAGLLTMAPALACASLMLARPYLGERAIARLRRRRRGWGARPSAVKAASARVRAELLPARAGRLLASALAGRAPPLALAGCR
jgi:hypothetical protein